MRRFFKVLWRVITFPFLLVYWVFSAPFRGIAWLVKTLNTEPEEHPLSDVLASAIQNKEVRQALWAHVEDLRKYLLYSLAWLAGAVFISFAFTQRLIEFLAQPVGGLSELKAIEVTESIGVFMRVALLAGVAAALPFIAFMFWLFAVPGLTKKERRDSLVGIPLAAILFLGGMAFAYFVLLPTALPFLLNFMGIQAELRPASYFNFVTGIMFWLGIAFEFPLVIYILTRIGLVKPQVLAQQWKLAIVIISILAAAITPTVDPVNMALVMLPMSLLYFVSIGLSFLAYAGRKKQQSA
ncbi:MAG: twin-arginine translocase subunit TatC [Chloroflexota bacterium]